LVFPIVVVFSGFPSCHSFLLPSIPFFCSHDAPLVWGRTFSGLSSHQITLLRTILFFPCPFFASLLARRAPPSLGPLLLLTRNSRALPFPPPLLPLLLTFSILSVNSLPPFLARLTHPNSDSPGFSLFFPSFCVDASFFFFLSLFFTFLLLPRCANGNLPLTNSRPL